VGRNAAADALRQRAGRARGRGVRHVGGAGDRDAGLQRRRRDRVLSWRRTSRIPPGGAPRAARCSASLIIAVNIIRIGTLGQAAGSAWFDPLHLYIWPTILTVLIGAILFVDATR
jgi:hypothetical protein